MGNELYQTKSDEFMIFAPYVMHHSFAAPDTSFRRIVLYFREEAVNSEKMKDLLRNGSGLYQPTPKAANTIHSYLNKLLDEQSKDETLHDETMNSLLNILLIAIMKSVTVSEKPETENRISKIIDYIEQNHTKDIKLQDITDHFYMSKYYLCHEFKKYTNRTIVEYINSVRVSHAQQLIVETKQSFTDIAEATGFSSSTHFYRTFKAIAGISPSQFRKNSMNIDKSTT
ncbi:MAG: AraC family transcriptional regulator [Lachnospira sp.]|nr:AraC family transcriptional regulator [Lachnospira sp.]